MSVLKGSVARDFWSNFLPFWRALVPTKNLYVFLNFSWYIAVTLYGMIFAKIMLGGVVVVVAINSSRALFVNDKNTRIAAGICLKLQ